MANGLAQKYTGFYDFAGNGSCLITPEVVGLPS
jgi:hypothetical protein